MYESEWCETSVVIKTYGVSFDADNGSLSQEVGQ